MLKKITGFGLAVLLAGVPLAGAEPTVDEIITKANSVAYYAGDDGLADVTMTITDAQGRERVREFRILRYDVADQGEQKFFVYFHKPADVAKMTYMVWKHPGADDDRWLYLPALDLVKRIAASDKRSSFVGSHFVYEDVSGRNIDDDVHTLEATDDTYYKMKNIPKDPKGLEFAYYFIWIDKTTFLPMKAEYYDERGEMIRTITALETAEVQGHPTVLKSEVKDLQRNGRTLMEFSGVRYDVGLKDDIFAERYLRRAPVQWIR
ncbi:MAG: outer membrane lipoprotein-sorting protein [Candidatus Omnitrophica bacterium]|nr:outer membrane lipoprotein-sorting protein [Candidatus Omnitrophota bacterium]